jgi:hypothetical protein
MYIVHPMERLRHVARSGGADPAVIVAETVDALTRLGPAPRELVPLCRNLVERNPTCGPLWWLCAHLLAKPEALPEAWRLAEQIVDDSTAWRLGEALAPGAKALTVGSPRLTVEALCERPDVCVSAVDAGDGARDLIRRLDRSGVVAEVVAPEATLIALRDSDVVLVEAEACSTDVVVASIGSGLAAAVATAAANVPVWLVAGRGRRLPRSYVEAIGCALDSEHETFPTTYVSMVASHEGVLPMSGDALGSECPAVPELLTI